MPLVTLRSPRLSRMLWSRLNPIRHIPSQPPSLLHSSRSRMSCIVLTVGIMSLVSDTLLRFPTMTVFCPSSAATLRQVYTPALCRLFCKIWEAILLLKCTVLARSGRNYRFPQPRNLHRNLRLNPHRNHHDNQQGNLYHDHQISLPRIPLSRIMPPSLLLSLLLIYHQSKVRQ